MEQESFCPLLWFSGFFGLAAAVHLARLISRVSVAIDGNELPLSLSALIVAVSAGLSVGLALLSFRRPYYEKEDKKRSSCCK